MIDRLARGAFRHRRLVVVTWVILLVGGFLAAGQLGGVFQTQDRLPGADAQRAVDLLERAGFRARAGESAQVVFESAAGAADPAVARRVQVLLHAIDRRVPHSTIVSPYASEGAAQIAAGGRIFYAEAQLADRADPAFMAAGEQIRALAARADGHGLAISLGGEIFYNGAPNGTSELVGLVAAMVILLVAFGSVIAMGLPILVAIFGVGCGTAIVLAARSILPMPDFTTAAIAMVGIGVGIDYALFIVTRYREALLDGRSPEDAVAHAIDTAGRSVLVAGTTVVISVLGLLLIDLSSTRGVAVAIAVGVLMTMLASITLLPAMLGFVGRNLDRLGLPHRRRVDRGPTFWLWGSHMLQRRPLPAAVAGLAVLLVLAAPVLSMRLGIGDAGNRPITDTTRVAYDTLARGFGVGTNGPLVLAISTPHGEGDAPVVDRLRAELAATSGVASVTESATNPAGDVTVMQVVPTTSPQAKATAALVARLRAHVVPSVTRGTDVRVYIGGHTAASNDYAAAVSSQLPVFIGAVLVLSFLLLMIVFRSVLVPLKAVVMNLLSIGAAYGVVVAVYQWGWGGGVFGVSKAGPVEAWAPVFLFAVVFGLSMDYEVFLLSRIREEYDRTGDNSSAVAHGVATTARVITAAAAVMVCVFGSFVFGPDRALALFGLGLAVAVLIDATVVRMLLVPATMELLGDRNWWLPARIARTLAHVHAPTRLRTSP